MARVGSGFSYYVSLKGVTGAGNIDTDDVARRVAAIREHVKLPIGVGFGIRDAATAKAVAEVADAVVIGSRIIQELENTPKEQAVGSGRRLRRRHPRRARQSVSRISAGLISA